MVHPAHLREKIEKLVELAALIGVDRVGMTPADRLGTQFEETLETVADVLPNTRRFPEPLFQSSGFVVGEHSERVPKHERYAALPFLGHDTHAPKRARRPRPSVP